MQQFERTKKIRRFCAWILSRPRIYERLCWIVRQTHRMQMKICKNRQNMHSKSDEICTKSRDIVQRSFISSDDDDDDVAFFFILDAHFISINVKWNIFIFGWTCWFSTLLVLFYLIKSSFLSVYCSILFRSLSDFYWFYFKLCAFVVVFLSLEKRRMLSFCSVYKLTFQNRN